MADRNSPDQIQPVAANNASVASLALTMLGGVLLAATFVTQTPPRFSLLGWAIFGVGVLATTLSVMSTSRKNGSRARSELVLGVKTFFKLLWALFP